MKRTFEGILRFVINESTHMFSVGEEIRVLTKNGEVLVGVLAFVTSTCIKINRSSGGSESIYYEEIDIIERTAC